MRRVATVLGCLVLLGSSVSAQVNRTTFSTFAAAAAAEECDCTGTCPKSSVPLGGRPLSITKFSLSAADFSQALGVDLAAALADPSVELDGASLQFSFDESIRPAVIGRDGEFKTFLEKDLLNNRLDKTDWFQERPSGVSTLGTAGTDRVTEPGLRKGSFPVPALPRERDLCRVAIRSSNSSTTSTCSNAIAALCPRGIGDETCTLLSLRNDVDRGDVAKIAALVKYDQACLRSDLPSASLATIDFDMIAKRTGALRVDLDKASGDCKTVGAGLSEGAAFCSAVVIGPDKILTARHCVVSKNKDWNDAGSCLTQDAVLFATLADPTAAVRVKQIVNPDRLFARTKVEDDYVVMTLASPLPGISGDLPRITAGAFTPAVIVSHHDLANPDPAISGPAWRQRVRWSRPQCSFTQIAGSCGVTNCQTIEGYSGAPVWVQDETGKTGLAGLQVGGGGADLRTCVTPNTLSTVPTNANLAIWGYDDDPMP